MKGSNKQPKKSTNNAKSDDLITRTITRDEYHKLFSKKPAKALKIAIEERKFQLEQYWRKITYYWALLGAIFIGFFSLQSSRIGKVELYSVLISAIGLIISFAWHLINRSGAYWHSNWDAHVHELERDEIGPLHRTRRKSSSLSFENIALPYRTSSTKLNNIVSLYVCFLWLFLFLYTLRGLFLSDVPYRVSSGLSLAVITFVFILLLFLGSKHRHPEKIEFEIEGQTLDSQ